MNHPEAASSPTTNRRPAHTRTITYNSYIRDDGLWDVEARVQDCKYYEYSLLERGPLPPGTPYHSIGVTLTVNDKLMIVEAVGEMNAAPFDECQAATDPLKNLVGATLGRGWRKAVDEALGRDTSCTHMREMLYMIASAAIQAIPGYAYQMSGKRWPPADPALQTPPSSIGGCVSWRQDGPVVLRHYPQFHKPKP